MAQNDFDAGIGGNRAPKPSDAEIRAMAQRLAEALKEPGSGMRVFTDEEAQALAVLAKIEQDNPGAIAAWVWLYDTAGRFRLIGVSLTGLLKWGVVVAGLIAAYKGWIDGWLLKLWAGAGK